MYSLSLDIPNISIKVTWDTAKELCSVSINGTYVGEMTEESARSLVEAFIVVLQDMDTSQPEQHELIANSLDALIDFQGLPDTVYISQFG